MQRGFSWVLPEALAGMPLPGYTNSIDADAEFLRENRVTLVVTLTPEPLPETPFSRRGIALLHLPVQDFSAPTHDLLETFARATDAEIGSGGRVAVHCAYGMGRTGTFLASYLVHRGMTTDAAVSEVRRLRPGSIETGSQIKAIRDFEARIRG